MDKPVLIAVTGGTGRHSLVLEHALRPMFTYLHAVVMPTAVFAAPEDWGGDGTQGPLSDRIERAARELGTEMSRRDRRETDAPCGDPVPFEQMLHGS